MQEHFILVWCKYHLLFNVNNFSSSFFTGNLLKYLSHKPASVGGAGRGGTSDSEHTSAAEHVSPPPQPLYKQELPGYHPLPHQAALTRPSPTGPFKK